MGNYVGIYIENKLALGMLVVRIITGKDSSKLVEKLKANGFGVTSINGEGITGSVKLIFTLIKRKERQNVLSLIQENNPKAFYSIEDVCMAHEGIFPAKPVRNKHYLFWLRRSRKGK